MRHQWTLPKQQELLAFVQQRRIKEILIEYDGPQVMLLQDHGSKYLALAVDEERYPPFVRWLQARISTFEWEALVDGILSVRGALTKPTVTIADYTHDMRPKCCWEIKLSALPERLLPEHGAKLPAATRSRFARKRKRPLLDHQPYIRLGGKAVQNDRIAFGRLSNFMIRHQALWSAMAPHLGPTASLSVERVVPGQSMVIQVHAEQPSAFESIASQYSDLLAATDDPAVLEQTLRRQRPGVAGKYSAYLAAIDLNEIELLANWGNGQSIYLGCELAQYTRNTLPEPKTESELLILSGYFEGMWRRGKPRFEFYDVPTGETVLGRIDPDLTKEAFRGLFQLALGRAGQRYAATVEVKHIPNKPPQYTLKKYTSEPSGEEPNNQQH